jgi:hypothetical protein
MVMSLFLATLAILMVGAGDVVFASGGDTAHEQKNITTSQHPSLNGHYSSTCPANRVTPSSSDTWAPISYVNTTGNVNVRQGAGTNYCVITTQGPTMDVVLVPGVSPKWDSTGTYKWQEVAFYENNCQSCSNYSWNATGWIVASFLTPATHGFKCVMSSGCDLFQSYMYGDWTVGGPFPSNPEASVSNCWTMQSMDSTGADLACHAANGYDQSTSSSLSGVSAAVANPNWFISDWGAQVYSYYNWNYDWWAH